MTEYRYSVILGVDLDNDRVAAAECGPFATKRQAEFFVTQAMGKPVDDAVKSAQEASQHDTDRWDLPVAGWTIETFTDDEGTQDTLESQS